MAVLALTSGLLDEFALAARRLGDGLAVGDLRFAGVGIDFELALHPLADDLQVEFAHPLDDGLASLLIGVASLAPRPFNSINQV